MRSYVVSLAVVGVLVLPGSAQDARLDRRVPPDVSLWNRGDGVASSFDFQIGRICLQRIADQATGECLTASSIPTLGLLFPYPGTENAFDPTLHAFVGGGVNNRAPASCATIGGGSDNLAFRPGGTVAGGKENTAMGTNATVGGGGGNRAFGDEATVGGGFGNDASGVHSTVGGGRRNIASGSFATVAGGGRVDGGNLATAAWSSIGGGSFNVSSGSNATVSGGVVNEASGESSTVGGGRQNLASGNLATVAGGGSNTPLNSGGNRATGDHSAVGGGDYNTASGRDATVAGGTINTASGNRSMVPGGFGSTAAGNFSFAAGRRAMADHHGAFVWSDSTVAPGASIKTSSTADEFNVYASGGARFFSNDTATTGVLLAPGGGSWTAVSDRAAKENVEPVDTHRVLEHVVALPIATWNYRSQEDSIRHMGPMAQDFYAAFELGLGETTIDTIDPDGVALAAIQGLHALVQEKDAELAELRESGAVRMRELEARLERLEQRLK